MNPVKEEIVKKDLKYHKREVEGIELRVFSVYKVDHVESLKDRLYQSAGTSS